MEIRLLKFEEREPLLELLNGWELPDGWQGRDFFRRLMERDPTYCDENFLVAVEDGELVGCVQIFPRRIRVLGHAIPAGGIGSVFTMKEHRGHGVATGLLEAAVEQMIESEMEISLLFGVRTGFYSKRGWHPWRTERSLLRRADSPAPGRDEAPPPDIEIVSFEEARDLAAVKAIHSAYSASRNGTVVRDDDLWLASLLLAGNPKEEFVVARRGGATVAYARCALLNGLLTITELARREDAALPLALIIAHMLAERDHDPLAPPELPSRQLRSAALLPAFDDLSLTVALEHRGFSAHSFEDPTTMLRCLNMTSMAERLDITLFPDEVPEDFLERILPRDSLVFWPADRF